MASTAFAVLILVGVAAFALKVAGPRDWKSRRDGASNGDAGGWVDGDCGDGGGDGGGD